MLRGQVFDVYAVDLTTTVNEDCPAAEFISQMPEASRKSMLNVLRRHATVGPIRNVQKSRELRDGIFEFKSRQGDRLLWFYDPERRGDTVITHGFHKGARLETEVARAKRLRDQYLEETT